MPIWSVGGGGLPIRQSAVTRSMRRLMKNMAGSSLVLQAEWLVSACGGRGRQWRKAGNPGRKAAAETGLCEARSGLFPLGGNRQG